MESGGTGQTSKSRAHDNRAIHGEPFSHASRFSFIVKINAAYPFPPGLEHNLLWYAFPKFRPHDPIHLFHDLAQRFGDIAHHKSGSEHIVFLNHPDFIREVPGNESRSPWDTPYRSWEGPGFSPAERLPTPS